MGCKAVPVNLRSPGILIAPVPAVHRIGLSRERAIDELTSVFPSCLLFGPPSFPPGGPFSLEREIDGRRHRAARKAP
jgi:hypothetical protein